MIYYKQFHSWPHIYWVALVLGGICLGLVLVWDDLETQFGFVVCAVFFWIMARVLWKCRGHFLDIDQEHIVHHGFKCWELQKRDVMHVEQGRKSLIEEYDPYLKVHAHGQVYDVDDGFLLNNQRIDELVKSLLEKKS